MIATKSKIYPILAVIVALFIPVFGLVMAKSVKVFYFVGGAFIIFAVIGCYKQCLRILPAVIIGGAIFGGFCENVD